MKSICQPSGQSGGKDFFGVIIGRALYENAFTLQEATAILGD